MPLETRRSGKSYYYRARRVNGRIVRTYVGAGDVALAAAQADADERARLVALRRAVDERQQQISAAIAPARQANDYLDSLTKAILIDAGYYRHDRGKWKLRSRRPEMIKPTKLVVSDRGLTHFNCQPLQLPWDAETLKKSGIF